MFLRLPPSLHHKRFRLLWFGLMISMAGSQMQLWAIFWQIRELTAEPIALGGIGLARVVPIVVFSLIGGSVADQASRRQVMFITQTVMALAALGLALLTFSGRIAIWHIYILTSIQAVAIAFDNPARQAIIPNLVPAKDIANAFSLSSMASQTGAIIGPALGGLVIAQWGTQYTYLINSLSFSAVLVSLLLIGPIPQQRRLQPVGTRRTGIDLQSIREGIRFIWTHPIILSTMVLDFIATFFSSANTLLPIITRDVLRVGAREYGWLSASQSIGAVLAALVISQLPAVRRQGPVFLVSVAFFGVATILFGLARSFTSAMLALILVGAADAVSTIIRNTIRQLQTPDYIRGRMIGINQIFFMGGPQLGEIEAGVVAQYFGAPFAIVTGGIGCLLGIGWVIRRWPHLLSFQGDEPPPAPSAAD